MLSYSCKEINENENKKISSSISLENFYKLDLEKKQLSTYKEIKEEIIILSNKLNNIERDINYILNEILIKKNENVIKNDEPLKTIKSKIRMT